MNKVAIFSWAPGSRGAKALAEVLGVRRLKHTGSKWKGGTGKTVINWGASGLPVQAFQGGTRILNHPELLRDCKDKLAFFRLCSSHTDPPRIPQWTDNQEVAKGWLNLDESVVFARTLLNSHSGKGISVLKKGVDFVSAPLYTMYVPKKSEYRVHIAAPDKVFFVQRKVKRKDFEGEVNWQIRNLDNGFVYAHVDVFPPPDVIEQAVKAFKVSELDFGAVDVIYNEKQGQAYVLEINTAPGLEGATVNKYANALKELVG